MRAFLALSGETCPKKMVSYDNESYTPNEVDLLISAIGPDRYANTLQSGWLHVGTGRMTLASDELPMKL